MNILAVDHDPAMRDLLENIFNTLGTPAIIAKTHNEALEIVDKTNIDLVFLDLFLSEGKGLETLRKMKKLSPETEVIALTGYASITTATEAARAGAFDFIEKPLNLEKMEVITRKAEKHVRLVRENAALTSLLMHISVMPKLITESDMMQNILQEVALAGPASTPVLISGEFGTGRELIARLIHVQSRRRKAPFLTAMCDVESADDFEDKLFGTYAPGSVLSRRGLLETGCDGTVFLEEISEAPRGIQEGLLEFLKTGDVHPLASNKTISTGARLIVSSSKDLEVEVTEGRFNHDLLQRLSCSSMEVPPLRERTEDIPSLVECFLDESDMPGSVGRSFSKEALKVLGEYNWPANVRELSLTVLGATFQSSNPIIEPTDLPQHILKRNAETASILSADLPLSEVEKIHIESVLKLRNYNKLHSARTLGISPKTLYNKLKTYNIPL